VVRIVPYKKVRTYFDVFRVYVKFNVAKYQPAVLIAGKECNELVVFTLIVPVNLLYAN